MRMQLHSYNAGTKKMGPEGYLMIKLHDGKTKYNKTCGKMRKQYYCDSDTTVPRYSSALLFSYYSTNY